MYLFEKPLIKGTMLKRKSQFTALVSIDLFTDIMYHAGKTMCSYSFCFWKNSNGYFSDKFLYFHT